MAAFLDALAARARGQAPLLAVRGRTRFEPRPDAGGSAGSDLSDLSDPSDLVATAVGSPAEPLASGPRRPAEHGGTVEPVLREQLGAGQVRPGQTDSDQIGPEQTASERRGARRGGVRAATGGLPAEPADADPAFEAPAPTTPGGASVTDAPDRRPPRNPGEPIDRRQVDLETDASIRTQEPNGRDHTASPEPVARQRLQPESVPPDRPSAGRADHPATASPTHPDPVRSAPRRRSGVSVPPPQQRLTEHVLPALIRAGLISRDRGDDVRLPLAWQPDEVRETIGAAGVPEVHVHIGRVEVTQASPAPTPILPAPAQAPRPPMRARPRLPAVDHDAYLARRRESDRGVR